MATVELSVPGAVATGSPQRDNTSRGSTNLISPDAPRERTSQKQALISTKLNEARIAREFSLIVGDQSVRRLSDAVGNSQGNTVTSWTTARRGAQSHEAAAQVMQLAAKEDLTVVPAGAATGLRREVIQRTRADLIIQHAPHDPAHSSRACRFGWQPQRQG